jgi:hypothetical protein
VYGRFGEEHAIVQYELGEFAMSVGLVDPRPGEVHQELQVSFGTQPRPVAAVRIKNKAMSKRLTFLTTFRPLPTRNE